eukprot:9499703-Pyramimonas_sp.AAC.1
MPTLCAKEESQEAPDPEGLVPAVSFCGSAPRVWRPSWLSGARPPLPLKRWRSAPRARRQPRVTRRRP